MKMGTLHSAPVGERRDVSRRLFLQSSAAGMLTLSLGTRAAVVRKKAARACILIFNTGGMSHLDLYDPKPQAPREIRGAFRAIRTHNPEMQLSELLPLHAKIADKFSLVRTCHHQAPATHALSCAAMYGERWGAEWAPAAAKDERVASGESVRTLERYGASAFGRDCLRARQAVEGGAQFVAVRFAESLYGGASWDVHGTRPFTTVREMRDVLAPAYDRGFSALVEDLDARGLLESTLVCSLTEFGRAPRINAGGGRDHWTHCFSLAFAGGGVQGGRVVGRSDAQGAYPAERPVTPQEVLATIQHSVGLVAGVDAGIREIHELF